MRVAISISALGICLLLASACGGQEPAGGEADAVTQAPPEQQTSDKSALVATELKPLDLPVERYVREMARMETESAYREPKGEYIDPRRVIELLHEGGAEPAAEAAKPEAESSAEGGWPIIADVQSRAEQLADDGNLEGAVEQWRGLLDTDSGYTISVEVDCDKSILRVSMGALRSLGAPVFMMPVGIQGRDCFRLCLGVFNRRSDVAGWIEKIKLKLPESVPFVLEVRKGGW